MKYTRSVARLLTSVLVITSLSVPAAAQISDSDSQSTRGQSDQRDWQDTSQRQQTDQHSDQAGELSAWRFIEEFDENGDGVLERSELPRRMRDQIDQIDRNDDGRLTAQELRQHGNRASSDSPGRHARPLEIVYLWVTDADSGHLSLNDLQQAYKSLQEIDENGDGQLSRDELRQRRQQLLERWAGTVTDRLDQNDDGRINPREAHGTFLLSLFDRLDANHDGQISQRELTQCVASGMHRGGHQEMRTGSRDNSQRGHDSQRSNDQQSQGERSL
jgi:Ca2+-binding EF-hand superfamily protein